MKDNKKPGQNPDVNTGKPTGTEKNPDVKKGETKTKGDEVWKDPDPTTPERKIDPDPTKPEKQEGPYSEKQGEKKPYADDSKQKKPADVNEKPADTEKKNPNMKKNPASVESNSDEEIGSLEEQDIDDQGITGESKGDDDFENEDRRKSA